MNNYLTDIAEILSLHINNTIKHNDSYIKILHNEINVINIRLKSSLLEFYYKSSSVEKIYGNTQPNNKYNKKIIIEYDDFINVIKELPQFYFDSQHRNWVFKVDNKTDIALLIESPYNIT